MFLAMRGATERSMRDRAVAEDEGAGLILLLILLAVTASLGAVGVELSLVKEIREGGAWRIGLAVATVAASWLFVQLTFALHYAHRYYAPERRAASAYRGGLKFPGEETPDYWDFLHFALVIGVASQTADIAFTSRPMRRIGTVHSVASFLFNTVVLAFSINLAASLF